MFNKDLENTVQSAMQDAMQDVQQLSDINAEIPLWIHINPDDIVTRNLENVVLENDQNSDSFENSNNVLKKKN